MEIYSREKLERLVKKCDTDVLIRASKQPGDEETERSTPSSHPR